MEEQWKDIVGFEGLYQISNRGNVRSLDHVIVKTSPTSFTTRHCIGKLLKPYILPNKHKRITLSKGKEKKTRGIAKLVAYHFLEGYSEIAAYTNLKFKDGDPSNCNVDNLTFTKSKD